MYNAIPAHYMYMWDREEGGYGHIDIHNKYATYTHTLCTRMCMYSCGGVLSAEELYKIDKTAMAEVLAEEGSMEGGQEGRAKGRRGEEEEGLEGDSGSEQKGIPVEGGGEEEEEEEKAVALELEEILRSCDEIQQKAGGKEWTAKGGRGRSVLVHGLTSFVPACQIIEAIHFHM